MSTLAVKYKEMIKKAEFSYFGLISMIILFGSCWGGIAAMMIFQNDAPIWQLGLNIGITMACNVAAIGQAPTKWLINLFIASFIINGLILFINL